MAKIDAGDLGHLVKTRQMMNDLGYSVETGPIVMYFLTRRMSDRDITEIQRMIPRRDFVDKWKHLEQRRPRSDEEADQQGGGCAFGIVEDLRKPRRRTFCFSA